MRHKWDNTMFRGVPTSAKQICRNCGLIKDNCFIPAQYIRNGIIQYSSSDCTTPGIEQMVKESELNIQPQNILY